jgi:NADH-quinone oxidoreductase subunit A
MTPLAAYVLLFVAAGVGFIFVHLVIGKLVRPAKPDPEKETIYECGEPTIGSAWVQFDLRFYVVALLFVIFDVEVAFFFPWAELFGKANTLASGTEEQRRQLVKELAPNPRSAVGEKLAELLNRLDAGEPLTEAIIQKEVRAVQPSREQVFVFAVQPGPLRDRLKARLDAEDQKAATAEGEAGQAEWGRRAAWLALVEIGVFFGVLLVGFAYLWRRGDLQWVRSTLAEERVAPPAPAGTAQETVGAAS